MAKQIVTELENGATVIYQKQSSFNGYSFVIGFRSGAQLDGKYTGLSHLLEHLFFRAHTKDLSKNLYRKILEKSIDQNAFTTNYCIASQFSAVHSNVGAVLDYVMDAFTETDFTPEQIKQEIDVIRHEIDMYTADAPVPSLEQLYLDALDVSGGASDAGIDSVLGSVKTLSTITPEVLKTYVERYFNLENLIISVTSNRPYDEVMKLCQDKIMSRVPVATDSKYVVDYPPEEIYDNKNVLVLVPDATKKNVKLALALRERIDYAIDTDFEYALDTIEEYIMNTTGGELYKTLRIDNNLAYAYSLTNLDYNTAKVKWFSVLTNGKEINKVIDAMCRMMRNIGRKGISRETFDIVKTALVDIENSSLNKYDTASAYSNFNAYMNNETFVDYKKVTEYIKNIEYEDFNSYIRAVYKKGNISLIARGDFDTRKICNIIELEQKLGNNSHASLMSQLNIPRVEATEITDSIEMDRFLAEQEQAFAENSSPVPDTVNIDDEEIYEEIDEQ